MEAVQLGCLEHVRYLTAVISKSFTREHPHCTNNAGFDTIPLGVYSVIFGWVLPQEHHFKGAYRALCAVFEFQTH